MALYSLSATPVGGAKTAARASATSFAAYIEREAEYETKDGRVTSFVLLPDTAPDEWLDHHILWAAVDEVEGAAGHVGTEYRGALAAELTLDQNLEALRAWLEPHRQSGRCIHVAIHESQTRPGELHFHAFETARGIDGHGKWINKRETYYPVRRNGEEITIPSADWKTAKTEGWEKIYPFRDGINRTKSEAEAEGLSWKEDRKSQKPLQDDVRTNNWGAKSTLYLYRETWATELNKALAKYAPDVEPVDHRSYADRGIDKVPQVKMGWHATKAERDEQARCERDGVEYRPVTVNGTKNEEIKRINDLLAEKAVPEEAKEELLDRGYELRDADCETAEQVRERTKPLFSYVRQAVADHIRRIVDRVLCLSAVKTLRSFVMELRRRNVNVSGKREYTYAAASYSFSERELGKAYAKTSIKSALADGVKRSERVAAAVAQRNRMEHAHEHIDYGYGFDGGARRDDPGYSAGIMDMAAKTVRSGFGRFDIDREMYEAQIRARRHNALSRTEGHSNQKPNRVDRDER